MVAKNTRSDESKRIALTPPGLTVLSDHKIATAAEDSFNLAFKLVPAYDILRHPNTETPLAMAIYGDWGTGKTSAMRWLADLLEEWNENGENVSKDNFYSVKPIWFFPWKYHSKEDVWRGLISEVIIESLKVSDISLSKITKAAKLFGGFLGRSFVHILANIKVKAGGNVGVADAEGEVSLGAIRDIMEEYQKTTHPEKAYLNEFESTFEGWINDTLKGNRRMVIFIDDLDRCLPEVALEVLEALKLYLNIDKLIFVVGVDRKVVDNLVQQHYIKLGLDKEKSANYLAKMFQIEIELNPSELQIESFLNTQLDSIDYWEDMKDFEKEIFKDIILHLAERNPREIKRLINSALMFGAGVTTIRTENSNDAPRFSQGLQLFFIRRILDHRYNRSSIFGTTRADDFFREWSGIVCGGGRTTLDVKLFEDEEDESDETIAFGNDTNWIKKPVTIKLKESDAPYHDLISKTKYRDLLDFMSDKNLGELMRIPFPSDATTQLVIDTIPIKAPEGLILEAIAHELGKWKGDVVESDYLKIEKLVLRDTLVTDINALRTLKNLEVLDLFDCLVSDINALYDLKLLKHLNLWGNPITDITVIRNHKNLIRLNLGGTKITDISAIKNLSSLQELDLHDTDVSDIKALSDIKHLVRLDIIGTQVQDITTLHKLKQLKYVQLPKHISEEMCKLLYEKIPGIAME